MTAPVLLCRIDHTRNMRRFYRLDTCSRICSATCYW